MIDSPKQNNAQIIDSGSIIFTKTIELSQKEDDHKYKDFKSLNLLYINSQNSDLLDFAKFDKQQDQVNLIIYFDGSHLTSIPQDIDELIALLDSKSSYFDRYYGEDQIRIYMCQHRLSYVNIAIDILKEILILIKKILLNEPSESKLKNETALLALLEHKLNLKEKESRSSPTISSDASSPSLEIPGDALLSNPIDGNISFDPQTPMKINQEKLFKFNYKLHERVTFDSQSYNIYNSPNNREITKISRVTERKMSIEDCVKNSIKIAIADVIGKNPDQEALLKYYEYLLIAIHSRGVKNKKIKYEEILTLLNGDSKRLNYEEAKELSKNFQSTCADEFNIYTGRIPNNHDAKLVGMRTKRIPLELLIETAKEELGADEFEKFSEVVEKLKNFIVTDFSKRKRHPEAQFSAIDNEESRRNLADTKKIEYPLPVTVFSARIKQEPSYRTDGKSNEEMPIIKFSHRSGDEDHRQIPTSLFSARKKQKTSSTADDQSNLQSPKIDFSVRKDAAPKTTFSKRKIQIKKDSSSFINMMEGKFVFKKLMSKKSLNFSKKKLLSIEYSFRSDTKNHR
jgi:hypothetical protein